MKRKFRDYKLVYKKGDKMVERMFEDTLYENVKRVGDSFPRGIFWRIYTA